MKWRHKWRHAKDLLHLNAAGYAVLNTKLAGILETINQANENSQEPLALQ